MKSAEFTYFNGKFRHFETINLTMNFESEILLVWDEFVGFDTERDLLHGLVFWFISVKCLTLVSKSFVV